MSRMSRGKEKDKPINLSYISLENHMVFSSY